MADTVGASFSYRILDELGIEATCLLYVHYDPATTIANIVAEYQSTSLLLDAIIGGQVLPGTCRIEIDPDAGVKASPDAGSRVEQTAVFDFSNNVTSRKWGDAVPSFSNSKITAGKINIADTDVVAWTTNLTSAVTTGHYSNNAFQQLVAVTDAFLSFRKRRKQLFRESLIEG